MDPHSTPGTLKASRGTLSARQLQDIRMMTRMANQEGATYVVHGVTIRGDTGGRRAAGNPQRQAPPRGDTMHDASDARPMDTGASRAVTNNKAQRDALRAAANRARKHTARWRTFARRLRYAHIAMPVWTEWMRSQMSPKRDARRKLRSVFWRAWTLRHIDGGGSSAAPFGETSPLGLQSHRDRFILRRARAVMAQAFPEPSSAAPFGPEDFMSEEQMLQAAIEASLISTPSETRGEADRTSTSRSLEEAGIKTPDSSRRDGKKRSGRRR